MPNKIAVFASGNGTNFVALHQAIIERQLPVVIGLLVCDQPTAPVIDKARAANVPILIVDFHDYAKAIPCFFCIIMMSLCYSISDGILLGLITWVMVHAFSGKYRDLSIGSVILALLFIMKYMFL